MKNPISLFLKSKGYQIEFDSEDHISEIKDYLNNQNPGRTSALVEQSQKSYFKRLDFNLIIPVTQHHFEKCEPRKPKREHKEPLIYGVVVRKNNQYNLVDGYHRLKSVRETNRKTGNYIVLE